MNLTIARQILSQFVRGEATCLPVDSPGFSEASVFRFSTDAGEFCVRCWPRESELGRVRSLHRLLEFLHSSGVIFVAVPLKASGGQSLITQSERVWHVEPWLPGLADFHSNPGEARLRAAFVALAEWHLAARRFVPRAADLAWFRFEARSPSPAVLSRLRITDRWLAGQLDEIAKSIEAAPHDAFRDVALRVMASAKRLAPRIRFELAAVCDTPVDLQPVLRDIWHDHVLFEGDSVSGLIDPAAASTDTVSTDLSRLIGSLAGGDLSSHQVAFEAYESVRRLSAAERSLIPTLDRSGVLLSSLTWLRRKYREKRELDEVRVVARLNRLAGRLDEL